MHVPVPHRLVLVGENELAELVLSTSSRVAELRAAARVDQNFLLTRI